MKQSIHLCCFRPVPGHMFHIGKAQKNSWLWQVESLKSSLRNSATRRRCAQQDRTRDQKKLRLQSCGLESQSISFFCLTCIVPYEQISRLISANCSSLPLFAILLSQPCSYLQALPVTVVANLIELDFYCLFYQPQTALPLPHLVYLWHAFPSFLVLVHSVLL